MVMYKSSTVNNKPDFDTDNAGEAAFVDFFRRIPPKLPGTVRLFDRGGYYSAHGDDALYVADNVYFTKTVLRYWKGSKKSSSSNNNTLEACTLSRAVGVAFLREALTAKQLRIEIWAPPSLSNGREKDKDKDKERWEVRQVASPGNLDDVEDLLFSAPGDLGAPSSFDGNVGSAGAGGRMLEAPICLSVVVKVRAEGGGISGAVKNVGMAFVDTTERTMGVCEFVENDIFSNTESLLIQLGIKEVILPAEEKGSEAEYAKLKKLIERCGIVHSERKKSDFAAKNIDQDLNGLMKGNVELSARPEYDLKLALSAASGLISYLDLLSSESARSGYTLFTHDLSQYMKLDASAVRALTLMPDAGALSSFGAPAVPVGFGGGSSSTSSKGRKDPASSLFALLNKCKTHQGTRMLAMWLKQPLVNLHQIENRQKLVEALVEETGARAELRDDLLKVMPDFMRIVKRFQNGRATLDDVVRTYQAVCRLPEYVALLERLGRSGETVDDEVLVALVEETYLLKLNDSVENLKKLIELVETTIDVGALERHSHSVAIKPEFDSKLQKIAADLAQTTRRLDGLYKDAADDLGLDASEGGLDDDENEDDDDEPPAKKAPPKKGKGKAGSKRASLKFENHQTYGYVFRLTRKESGPLKGKKGYIELANRTNGVYFTTKKLKELNNEYKDLQAAYDRTQSNLAKEVVSIAASYAETLEILNGIIAHLDVVQSLAHVANNAPIAYVKPKVVQKGQGDLILRESRHPCLETLPEINFIPNDVEMIRDKSEFQIITGANTGGKSVYLRQIGCIALMAQMGSFVPASEATVPIFDCILSRVGAGDSQLKGISTFMAEMLETATILKSATKDSLIIIDELGRGTSTYDGFGLAWAISEHIATKIRCFSMFATHFHDLTTLSEQVPTVKNLHVLAHVEEKSDSITGRDIVMLYKVIEGISDQSFGIHVAELAKFPDEVVRLAKRKADELEEEIAEDLETDAFTSSPSKKPKFTAEEIAEGTSLVAEMLQAWQAQADEALPELPLHGEAAGKEDEARAEQELALLKKCFEGYRERLEASSWAGSVLMETY